MSLYIGVDPGASGGIVAIDDMGAVALAWAADGRGGGDGYFLGEDPDPMLVAERLRALRDQGVVGVALETPFALRAGGTTAALTTGRRWGVLYAAIRFARVPVVTVTPAKWSADLFGGKKGDDAKAKKAAAVRLVNERLPDLRLVLPGCRTPHDGLADAGALALWMRAKS
jgi:hypothetical protein